MAKPKNFSVETGKIKVTVNGETRDIDIVQINIFGRPTLAVVRDLMDEIRLKVAQLKQPYVSVTDFRKLNIPSFIKSIILHRMESTYKDILAMEKSALISFVMIEEDQEGRVELQASLEKINEAEAETTDYQYNYVFITDDEEIPQVTTKYLQQHPQKL